MYLLQKTNCKGVMYVAKSGSASSYTTSLLRAEKFETYDLAVKNSCVENERPVKLAYVLYYGDSQVL